MSNQGFIALHRGDIAETLLGKHPNAFLLLTQIALRARWKDCPITGMKQGEAFIGDHKNAGIQTEKAYRHAKEILVRASLVSFKGANKGTVATLTDTSIFSTTAPDRGGQGADKGRTRGGQGATKNKDTQDTQTLFATSGARSDSSQKSRYPISWSESEGFTGITERDRAGWAKAFPAVNIDRAIAAASEWLLRNPSKRKKHNGRFISGWLSRNQERGGDTLSAPSQPNTPAGSVVINGRAFKA